MALNIKEEFNRQAPATMKAIKSPNKPHELVIVINPLDTGLFPQNPDTILQAKGILAYHEMEEQNPTVARCVNARKNAILGMDISFEAAVADDPKEIQKALDIALMFEAMEGTLIDLTKSLLNAMIDGFGIYEPVWRSEKYQEGDLKGKLGFWKIKQKPSPLINFKQDEYRNVTKVCASQVLGNNYLNAGIQAEYDPWFFWHLVWDKREENPYGRSILRPLYFYHYIAKEGIKQASTMLDRFGSPVKLAVLDQEKFTRYMRSMYPDLEDDAEGFRDVVAKQISRIQADLEKMSKTNLIINYDFITTTILESTKVSDTLFKDQQSLVKALITETILGATLNTSAPEDAASGNRALGEVHERATDAITQADVFWIEAAFNDNLQSPIKLFCDINYSDNSAGYPKLRLNAPWKESIRDAIYRMDTGIKYGISIPKGYAQDVLNIPAMEEGDEALVPLTGTGQAALSKGENSGAASAGIDRVESRAKAPKYDPIPQREAYLDKMMEEMLPVYVENMIALKNKIIKEVGPSVDEGDVKVLTKIETDMTGTQNKPGWLTQMFWRLLLISDLNGRLYPQEWLDKISPERKANADKREAFPTALSENDDVYKFFKDLTPLTKSQFKALEQAYRFQSIAFAGIEEAAVSKDVQLILLDCLQNGKGLDYFNEQLAEKFVKYTSVAYGDASLVGEDILPSHAETIFRTNMMKAYSAGEQVIHEQAEDDGTIIAYTYRVVIDSRERSSHRALDGKSLAAGDPLIKRPPLGFNCRCHLEPRLKGEDIQLTDRGLMARLLSKVGFDVEGG